MDVINFVQPQDIRKKRFSENGASASISYAASADMLLHQQPVRSRPAIKTRISGPVLWRRTAAWSDRAGLSDTAQQSRPAQLKNTKTADTAVSEVIRRFFRLRYILAAAALGGALAGGWTFAAFVYDMYPRSISFNTATAPDFAVSAAAMKNFVLPLQENSPVQETAALSGSGSFIEPVKYKTYTVRKGDNITSIAKQFGLVNISSLISVNNISNVRRIQAGQKLSVPGIDGIMHTVAKNESLAGIAALYKVSVDSLLDVNDLSSTVIHTGDTLFIPGATLSGTDLKKAMGELFMYPLSGWRLTSSFGTRNDPFTGVKSFHTGIDMAAPAGTPIYAALEGKVAATGYSNVYGNYVIVSHSGGYQTLYGHMTSYNVKKGQNVGQRQQIGKVGSTGYSTGSHLHFTVYKNGKMVNPFDYLN